MKQLVTFLALGALVFAGYRFYTDQAMQASKMRRKTVTLSRVIEPLHRELTAPLNHYRPADLVPQLEITRERILDARMHAEPEKQAVYTHGITLLETMIACAEERTKALEALVRTAKGKNSLDSPATTSTSSAFFAQNAIKRWEGERTRRKPALDQLLAQLRNAER